MDIEEIKKEILLKIMRNGEGSWRYIKTLPKDDTLRVFICELGHVYAYYYACYVDESAHPYTRTSACRKPKWAYYYAKHIEKCPHEETRKAACKDPEYAYWYASAIDNCPRDDTRNAACRASLWGRSYLERFGEDVPKMRF